MVAKSMSDSLPNEVVDLRPSQLLWLAAAIFIISAGYGALMPLLPAWIILKIPEASSSEVARQIGFLSGVYAFGVLVGAPLWGLLADRIGQSRVLIIGLIGHSASLILLLLPSLTGLLELYVLRGTSGFFLAAVLPIVTALVAKHTPDQHRARRFAWFSAMSLLGFLFGPALSTLASWIGSLLVAKTIFGGSPFTILIVLSALLGAVVMSGLLVTLPVVHIQKSVIEKPLANISKTRITALLWLNGLLMLVLASFELSLVLLGQSDANSSTNRAGLMLAECSLVMLGINALLFFTALLEKVPARILIGTGLILAMVGLLLLAMHKSDIAMYLGVSLTSAGIGLVLPVIAYLAASTARQHLGITMGSLAAAAGLGQTLGSTIGGWLFAAIGQIGFGWQALPLAVVLILLLTRPTRNDKLLVDRGSR